MKKEWKTPQLIVLYRGRPEERVLDGCKAPSIPAGAVKKNNKCDQETGGPCGACHPEPAKGS